MEMGSALDIGQYVLRQGLTPEATIKKFLTVRQEGSRAVRRELDYYNLDMIISVGYRVKSHEATRFRIWATQRLREYIVKGFVLDDERLKEAGGGNYFDELLARIRDIRSSEKVFCPACARSSRLSCMTSRIPSTRSLRNCL